MLFKITLKLFKFQIRLGTIYQDERHLQVFLVLEQRILHFPEFPLGSGSLRGFSSQLGMHMC